MNMRYHNNDATIIGRLGDQAHNATVELYNERMKTEHPGDIIFYDMFNQKFAELIVQECAGFLRDNLDDHFAAEQLEEHFGVEE